MKVRQDGQHSRPAQWHTTADPVTDREFWRRVLAEGGHTPVPRWSGEHTAPGVVAEHRTALPAATAQAVRRLADDLATDPGTVLLAACARVLAALTSDSAVVVGYLGADGPKPQALPCPVPVADGPWRDLLHTAARAAAAVTGRPAAALAELRAETAGAPALFDTLVVAGRAPRADDLAPETVLAVGLDTTGPQPELVLGHRPRALDADQAGRISGYLLAALDTLTRRPEADHHTWSPVSAAETAHQLDGLAGPERELPDRRVHQLFEEQARLRPQDIAAEQGARSWTYRELNARANRIAHALRARGLRDENAVAVVSERNLEWLAAVLGVLKAGGVYLPVEPHFPAGRIADMLTRSECRHVLAERDACAGLPEALRAAPGAVAHHLDDVLAADHPDTDPGLPVAASQGAYIYFTSGSTGRPKGALCEHAGFLNHLLAKIEDFGVREGGVVAQSAPQCFDISLWQLVAALAVGGRTRIIEQAAVLDVARFVETLERARVEVVQVVPSYLEVVLTELERHPRELPHLRCVSATGEALKKDLVARWFAAFPDVALANAYGLTETSDDTNHEVMRAVPEQASVPLGRPIAGVRIYVVDELLRPVPLGSSGEIVFSGVCVGRGYVNDEERTRAAFVPDPYRPGARMYRSGDFGRWLPDGRLEFLGRRDAQVKISGFRIEIGEVENQLLRVSGVRDSAVVITGEGEHKQLVAFYSAAQELPAQTVGKELGAALPAYMVPGRIHYLPVLPLTSNGKIDRKALTRTADELGAAEGEFQPPRTDHERKLAALWAAALKLPADTIGRDTHFFEAGGTSLAMLRLAVALDRTVTPAELMNRPVLADLAALLDERAAEAAPAV
ncbi:amino acid adenylation domain-containing protein [Streptomyces sp. NPDC047049]|uniref:amino acid adenylation domain-containing protein n=1 Tax=Streptomyces sp. NPDC047049 TaxID=3156688 RepID=UPI0033D35AEF